MCHPEVPPGQPTPAVEREDIRVPLTANEEMPALFCAPEMPRRGAVLVVPDVFGRSPFYENLGARLAEAGFQSLVVDVFFRLAPLSEMSREAVMGRMRQLDQKQTLRDLDIAINWLQQRPYAGGSCGTIGFCMGGTLVLDLAADREDLATVCFYGFPAGAANSPLPPPAPLEVAGSMSGPILGFWGDQDEGVGMENVGKLDEALIAKGVEHDFKIYPGLGHGFMSHSALEQEKPGYRESCEAWTRTLEFYREHVR